MNTPSIDFWTRQDMLAIPGREIGDADVLVSKPLVSVVMMTRNHEQYLAQAVASVMAQQCDFVVELLLGEDHSSDNTRSVAAALQAQHPAQIRLIVADTNVGITANFLRLVARANGKYIALLEGDDYWTDTAKLQTQVRVLETHPDYAWCGTKTINRQVWAVAKESYALDEILRRYLVHTSSVLFRAETLVRYPRFPDKVCWESMLFGYLSAHGRCGFIDAEMSYYRRHAGGLWTGAAVASKMQMTGACIDALDAYFGGQYRQTLADRELWIYRMDTQLSLQDDFWPRWLQSLQVAQAAWPRLLTKLPGRYLGFCCAVLLQPFTRLYLLMRRKLALRKRWQALEKFFAKT